MNDKDENLKSEFEAAPNSKVRVVATVDQKLCEEIKRIHAAEVSEGQARRPRGAGLEQHN